MNSDDSIKFAEHLRIAQVYLNDAGVNILIQDKQYAELLNNFTRACISLQEMAIILAKYAIQESFSDVKEQIKKDINDISGSNSKM